MPSLERRCAHQKCVVGYTAVLALACPSIKVSAFPDNTVFAQRAVCPGNLSREGGHDEILLSLAIKLGLEQPILAPGRPPLVFTSGLIHWRLIGWQ
jgi:hypothetical protein